MDLIETRLVVGIGVHRRHESLLDPDRVVQHFRDGSQAIGGAGGVGNDEMLLRQLVVIDAVDDGEIGAVRRRRDEHALGARLQMHRGLFLGGENAGALQRDVDAEIFPRQLAGILDRRDFDPSGAAVDAVALNLDLAGEATVNGIEP